MSADYGDYWKAAFAIALSELEGVGSVPVRDIYNALPATQRRFSETGKALLTCLGEKGWRWKFFNKPLDSAKDYKEMALLFAARVEMLAHGLNRKQQLMEVAERRPYWEFSAGLDDEIPERCRAMNGTIKHLKSPSGKTFSRPATIRLVPVKSCRCRKETLLKERDIPNTSFGAGVALFPAAS